MFARDGRTTRLHAGAGARGPRWSLDLERAPGSAAADADGVVVTMGNEGVVAFDRAGGEVWSTRVEGVGLDWPVIADDVVVLPTTRVAGDGDRAACVALDRSTGAERWQVEVGAGPVASVGAGGDTVVCASARGHLAAVGRDGALRWTQDVEAYLGEGPISVSPRGSVAVAPESGRVGIVLEVAGRWKFSCWDLTTGADAGCSLDLGPGAPPSAAAADGSGRFVLGLGAGRDGAGPSLAVIDPGAGLMREIAATAAPFDPSSIPLVTGETAVVVDRLGGVTAVDLAAMELRWRAQLRQPVLDARPVRVAPGVVRVVDWTGQVHEFDLADGRRTAAVDDAGGAIGVVADPAGALVVTMRRGLGGNRLQGHILTNDRSARGEPIPSKEDRGRPLLCPSEPGQSTRNDARP